MIKSHTAEQLEVILDECIFTAQDPEMHSTATSVSTEQIIQLIDSAITEARLDGRRIQAEASFDKWKWYKEQNRQLDFDVFLSGQVDSHQFELAQLKNNTTKQEDTV